MYQKITKTKNLLTIAMLFVFCTFTNNVMAWDGNGTAGNPWKIGDTQTNTATAVTAVLNGNTLKISGKGNMADFWSSLEGEAPWWFNTINRNAIQFVTIDEGITNIGQRAFKDCSNLQAITIPSTVVKINEQAFYNCTSLYAVIIPKNVATIGDNAFYNCTGLLSIANLRTTPQNINSNVFQGVALSNIYLATPKEATANYQSANVWRNFKFVAPFIITDEGNYVGLDGTALFFDNWENNPNTPKQITVYDGVSDNIKMIATYHRNGVIDRVVIDDEVFIAEVNDDNTMNIIAVNSQGNDRSVYGIDINFPWTPDDAKKLAVGWAGTMLDVIVEKSYPLGVVNTTPSWIGLTDLIVSTLGVDKFMPPSVKAIYTGYMTAFSAIGTLTSCGNMIFFASTGAGLPLAFLSSSACVASAYNTIKGLKDFQEALSALNGNNSNTNCSVTATLYGGTLIISGSGALCADEINKFADRKNEITKLIICGGVTSIPNSAFSGYINLKIVDIQWNNNKLELGCNAFYNSGVETLYLGRNIQSGCGINSTLFGVKLKTVTIGNNVTTINASAFSGCTVLTSLSIGSKVETIGSLAFDGCSSLTTNIRFPSSVKTIGSSAFSGCVKLPSIFIPSSVTSIGNSAFSGCSELKTVEIQGDDNKLELGCNAFYNSGVETLILGRNIQSGCGINSTLFGVKLKIVTIGNNVTTINASAFSGCTGLTQIISNATTPPTLQSNTFSNVNKSIPVYINCHYVDTYKVAQYWRDFTNYQCAVQIVSASNSAVATFPKIDNATTYTMSIYSDENYTNRLKEVHLDANGNLRSAATTLSCTVAGLSANTRYYYSLTPYNANGNMLTVFTGEFTTTIGGSSIENVVADQMTIYPNPVKDEIFIKSDLQIEKVEIYALTGSLLLLENNFNEKMSVSALPRGVYLLKVYTDKETMVSKIIKE
jgi:hypothetical protein